jgi:hypothetical protein
MAGESQDWRSTSSLHLMLQPYLAMQLLSDPLLWGKAFSGAA